MNPLLIMLIVFGGLVALFALGAGVALLLASDHGPNVCAVLFLTLFGAVLGGAAGAFLEYVLLGTLAGGGAGILFGVVRVLATSPSYPGYHQRLQDVLGRNGFGRWVYGFTEAAGSTVGVGCIILMLALLQGGMQSVGASNANPTFLSEPRFWKIGFSIALGLGVLVGTFREDPQWGKGPGR